jgi:hypothetical protein
LDEATVWRVWVCPTCESSLKVNKDLDEQEYLDKSACLCGDRMTWRENKWEWIHGN